MDKLKRVVGISLFAVLLMLVYKATVFDVNNTGTAVYVLDDGMNQASLVLETSGVEEQVYHYDDLQAFCLAVESAVGDKVVFEQVILELGMSGCGGSG
tara:strand:- start:21 stop:314 length:294 start_codon:yes stop_codon:yes gene_type:complete